MRYANPSRLAAGRFHSIAALPSTGRLARLALQLLFAAQRRLAAWRVRQCERATCRALGGLDARALRDIGLDRSEIGSVAHELADPAATRIHVLRAASEWR